MRLSLRSHPAAPFILRRVSLAVALGVIAPDSSAQDAAPAVVLDPVVVTATRSAARSFNLPASVDSIDAATIRNGQPMVNLSETLARVPGVVALNRQNYAQDLQISSRGFGARSTFGVRGIRLYQDDIPATMPDGQGQTGSFSLLAAQRIEVLRGPFSTIYGNASGGVIAVFTEDGTDRPEATATLGAGSYGAWTAGAKLTGSTATAALQGRYVIAGSRFETDGFRDHSAARRDLLNAKVTLETGPDTHVTLLGSTQYQPESQDPLGLTRAQWEANPRGVDASALQFDTRKTIRQDQGGATLEQRLGGSTMLNVTGYAGQRRVRQYLALSGVGATSSGGVVDLDRGFGGLSGRLVWRGTLAAQPVAVTVGTDVDRQDERRRGFVNNDGALGNLRRDEDDSVTGTAFYGQVEWSPWPLLGLTAGLRSASVDFKSADHYINAVNPDDSGTRRFNNVSPVLGAVYHASDRLRLYASYGAGFETPTFAELAYRPGGTGLNFGLDAATSRAAEIGIKAILNQRQRVNVALFATTTRDEIVIDSATGGRTIFKNAGRTRRRGIEAMWEGRLTDAVTAHLAYTALHAVFADAFTTGSPPAAVGAGARLPGVPAVSAYGEINWNPGTFGGFNAALEVQYTGRIYVNERNSDATPSATIANARIGFAQRAGGVTWREFVRLNNLADRNYVGSLVVGDTNGRYFEPAPGRNWFAGVSAHAVF